MERVLITEREASVRVGTKDVVDGGDQVPEGCVTLTLLAYNQEVPVTLTLEERKQLIAWLKHPSSPTISPEVF